MDTRNTTSGFSDWGLTMYFVSVAISPVSVSYTHLDVYKRQLYIAVVKMEHIPYKGTLFAYRSYLGMANNEEGLG